MKLCVFRLCCVWNCEPACDLLTFFHPDTDKNRMHDVGCSSLGTSSDRHAADAGSIPRWGKGFFSQSQLSCRLSYRVRTHPCAIARINICAHVIDPVVHIRVRWIIETLKHWTCTVVWVVRPCRSWLSPGKAIWISHGRNPIPTIG